MIITNESHMCCSKCGIEASGISDIQKVFGLTMDKKDIKPFSECRKCRGVESEEEEIRKITEKPEKWLSAATWGKTITISRKTFDSYLIELGYLEHDDSKKGIRNHLRITKTGKEHSKTKKNLFGLTVLWDETTYFDVVKLRLSKGIIHDVCPKCKSYLDTMPGFNHFDSVHKCKRCGTECHYWYVKSTYDR